MTDTNEFVASRDIGSIHSANDRMQTFSKQMLKTRTFLGHYQENRLVQSLQSYRALVVISRTDEALAKDVQIVRSRIKSFYSNNPDYWVGYTGSDMIGVPNGACIWTELEGLAFGEYWFQIKTIKFRNNEAMIKLKMLKPMHDVEQSIKQDQKIKEEKSYDSSKLAKDFQELIDMWRKASSEYFLWLFSQQITAHNIASFLKFMILMTIAVCTAFYHGLIYLGAFTLKFMEEFRKIIHVLMPLILKIIDLISKVIGGAFILLAMIWRDIVGRKNPPSQDFTVHKEMGRIGYREASPILRPIEYRPDLRTTKNNINANRYRRY